MREGASEARETGFPPHDPYSFPRSVLMANCYRSSPVVARARAYRADARHCALELGRGRHLRSTLRANDAASRVRAAGAITTLAGGTVCRLLGRRALRLLRDPLSRPRAGPQPRDRLYVVSASDCLSGRREKGHMRKGKPTVIAVRAVAVRQQWIEEERGGDNYSEAMTARQLTQHGDSYSR